MAILNNAIVNGSARFLGLVYFNSIATATAASGDKMLIYDNSDPTLIKASVTFGSSTSTYLRNDGTWGTPPGTGGGSQGPRGSLWFCGTINLFLGNNTVNYTDSSSAHVAGDIYLRSDTYNVYKCTADVALGAPGSWSYVCNIKGANGTNGTNGTNGIDGNMIWTTTSSPTTPSYTFTISNLSGPTGATPKVGDIVITSNYRYTITSVSSTTVLTGSRVSIKGAKGDTGPAGSNAVISWTEQTSSASNCRIALKGTNNTVYYSTSTLEYNPGEGLFLTGNLHMGSQLKIHFVETSGQQSYIDRYRYQFSPTSYLGDNKLLFSANTYFNSSKLQLGQNTFFSTEYLKFSDSAYILRNHDSLGDHEHLYMYAYYGIDFNCDKTAEDGGGLKFTPSNNEEYYVMYVPSGDLPTYDHSSQENNGDGYYNTGLYTNYVVPKTGGTFKGKVTVQGNVTAQGFFQDSDINLKNVQDYIALNNSDIAKLPIFDFLWRNKKDKDLHSGTSALEVLKLLPTLVLNGSEGLILDYATLGSILGINAARELEMLKKRVKELEEYISHGTNSH